MGYDGRAVLEFLARTHETSLLTDREKHLIGLAVTMTRGCQVCTRGRIEKARAAGIGDDILNALSSSFADLRTDRDRAGG
jgi:alkylhydroperoxidase/carboxymuconolactone decarboxylase family protein YurZ